MEHRDWAVSHSLKGNWITLYALDRRARLWRRLSEAICFCDTIAREWTFHVPTGWPRWERDGDERYLSNSLGSRLYAVETWFARREALAADRCVVRRVEISPEETVALVPEWAFLFEDDDEAA